MGARTRFRGRCRHGNGNYIFPGLDSGDCHLLMTAPGYDSQPISGIHATGILNISLGKSRRKGSRTANRIYAAGKAAKSR